MIRLAPICQTSSSWRKVRLVVVATLASLLAVPATAAASQASSAPATDGSCPWVTSPAPIAQRVAQLMSQMTLADEISMVEGHGTDQPVRVLHPGDPGAVHPGSRARGRAGRGGRRADRGDPAARRAWRSAATWDPSLASQYGQVIGAEEAGKGASANLGPTVNIDRDPRWGRSFEALSEDPFLNAVAGRSRDRRRAGAGRDVAGQALRRLQPGDVPQHARPTT